MEIFLGEIAARIALSVLNEHFELGENYGRLCGEN
jgi:hypothetical protein